MNMFFRITLDYNTLADEIVANIPEKHFMSETDTFLDPAFAGGQFLKAVARRLNKYGHSLENIRGRLFGYEDSVAYLNHPANYSTAMIANLSVVKYSEFPYMDNKKFDVILGNPPYQHPTNKSKKIWADIISCVGKYLKNKGTLAFVTPNVWMIKPQSRGFVGVQETLQQGLKIVDKNCNKHFSVGEDLGYWIVENGHDGSFDVLDNGEYVSSNEKYDGSPIIFDFSTKLVFKLQNAFKQYDVVRNNKIVDFYYSTKAAIEKGVLSKEKTTEYNIPVFITANQTAYTKEEFVEKSFKLILNKSGYYYSDTTDKYMLIPDSEYYGVGEGGVGIRVDTVEDAYLAKEFYSKKIFRFYIDNEKTSGFNSGLMDLPILDYKKSWTDQELYTLFGLEQEEIDYINDCYTNVK